jgi:hypothetical protein
MIVSISVSLISMIGELLEMKLSSGKLQFWECKQPPVGAGQFLPCP